MSVGGNDRDMVSRGNDDGHAVHIEVTDNKTPRKLTVESYDEVFYPHVSIIRQSNDQSTSANETKLSDVIQSSTNNEKPDALPVRRSRLKKWLSRFGAVATATVVLLAVALIGARLLGFRTFTVMSGSMEPEYPVGSMIYVRPTDYHDLKVGDVISYVADNDKTIVTHRIASIEVDKKDQDVYRFRTKGDANSSPDSNLVHYKNVLGTPIITIPLIGYVAHNIQQPPGIYIMLVVGTLLLAWTFLPGTLEERRKTARKSVA